ncbi:MAG TPA: FkbM family methyltransferase [Gemmatimonadaceae bacterium]|nr:FkbM family methyltransferase [Gemmatimonadaceae bacterium]
MMFLSRGLRDRFRRILPEFIKRPLRGRLYGFVPARSALRAAIHEAAGGSIVTVNGSVELRVPASALPDVRYHLVDNGESMDEIANLLQVAREPGGLLFDVGGHKSLLSELFCLASPRNRAISYEPSPSLRRDAAQIRSLNGLDDRLVLSANAIGDRSCRVAGYVDGNGLIAFGDAPTPAAAIPVEFTTLDAECDRLGVSPEVVKIDIEGFEDQALAGAERLLAEHPPILLLEFHLDLLEQRGVRPRDLLAGLERRGYGFFSTTGRRLSARDVYGSARAVMRFMARPASAR